MNGVFIAGVPSPFATCGKKEGPLSSAGAVTCPKGWLYDTAQETRPCALVSTTIGCNPATNPDRERCCQKCKVCGYGYELETACDSVRSIDTVCKKTTTTTATTTTDTTTTVTTSTATTTTIASGNLGKTSLHVIELGGHADTVNIGGKPTSPPTKLRTYDSTDLCAFSEKTFIEPPTATCDGYVKRAFCVCVQSAKSGRR